MVASEIMDALRRDTFTAHACDGCPPQHNQSTPLGFLATKGSVHRTPCQSTPLGYLTRKGFEHGSPCQSTPLGCRKAEEAESGADGSASIPKPAKPGH